MQSPSSRHIITINHYQLEISAAAAADDDDDDDDDDDFIATSSADTVRVFVI